MAADAMTLSVPGPAGVERAVRLSSPDKPVWPAHEGSPPITKKDLVDYLLAVADPFLAGVGGRPVTLQRFRGGIAGEEFYTKNPPKGTPEWFSTVVCTYPSGRRHPQLVIEEIAAAVWAVQMSTVTFHPWPVQADDPDLVDELRIDLDPAPERSFADVVEAARVLGDLMREVGLTPWPKTSGNRGVHVYARLHRTHEFLDVRHAVIGIARELERRIPDLVTTAWWKEERGEKIFVDYNQANRDRTIAAAYSPRPLPGATVSTPLTWEELHGSNPASFTIRTVPDLLRDRGDAWSGLDAARGHLDAALTLWQSDVERGLPEMPFPPEYPKMPGEPPRVQPSKKNAQNWG